MRFYTKIFIFSLFVIFSFGLYKITSLEYKRINFYFFLPNQEDQAVMLSFKNNKSHFTIENKDIFSIENKQKRVALYNKSNSFFLKQAKSLSLLVKKYKNRSVWSLSLKSIAKEIQNIFPSKKIHLRRKFPNIIEIYMKESLPVLLLLTKEGKFYPVFHEGEIGSSLSAGQLLDLPILRGDIFKKDKSLRAKVSDLLKILPKKEIFSSKNISEIVYKPKRKSFSIYLIPHYFVLEIKPPWKEKAVKNINFVLNYLIQKEEKAIFIDAGFPEKIIVRRKKDSEN